MKKHNLMFQSTAAAMAWLLFLSSAVQAQSPFVPVPTPQPVQQTVSPFDMIGFMQSATVDNPGDTFSGGAVTLNGIKVTVPRNTLFQMPASTMTWGEMFLLAPPAYRSLGQSGLALSDTPAPFATYEVRVVGNRIARGPGDDKYVAGLVFISQQSLNSGQGFINRIDYATGELLVGSTIGATTGARVRINDPLGRYGRAGSPDERFSVDSESPTIHAESGYPMCIPRTDPAVSDDPLCPQRNRPVDQTTQQYQTNFTMRPNPATTPPGPVLGPREPDATQQTPFEVNDYITYAGTLVKDPVTGAQYISAHTITAELGIFTWPGTMPAYVSIEEMLLGVGGAPNPLFPQEAVEKLVLVAFTTDPSALVDMYAVDVDACGNERNRFLTTADPAGPPVGGLRGRARVRSVVGNFLPPARELRVASRTFTQGGPVDPVLPTAKRYANGLIAGQYHAPLFEYIFPERLVLGGPVVPFTFQEFPFLVNGSGPYFGAGSHARSTSYGNLGQITPFPALNAPLPQACGAGGLILTAPFANAGSPQTVNSASLVTLNASQSVDTNNPPLPLSYTWLQTGGTPVTLNNPAFQKPTFTAPTVAAGAPPQVLTFSLVVSNGFASSGISTVSVTVVGASTPIVNAGAPQLVNSTATVTLSGSAIDPNGAAALPLKFQWKQTSGPAVAFTPTAANTASVSFTAPTMAPGQAAVTLGFTLTVTDSLATPLSGSATTSVTVQPLPDVIRITSAIYRLAKSRLDVTATSSVTNGLPVLKLRVAGSPDITMANAGNGTYTVTGATVNPIPSVVTVVSSFGGSASSPLTGLK